jgi:dipeptidyl aminopeptidase/acylaminoacyl peptidase
MTTELIPLEVLFANPEHVMPQVSPDGKRLAYLAPYEGVLNVYIGEVGSHDFRPLTRDAKHGIGGIMVLAGLPAFLWAKDNRHILFLQDDFGDENWRVKVVDTETEEVRDLTPFEGVAAQLLATNREYPNEVLIGLNKDNPMLHEVYRVDIRSGELTKVAENPGFLGWIVDTEFRVRGATRQTSDGGSEILVRESEDDEWEVVLALDPDDSLLVAVAEFTGDGNGLYLVTSAGSETGRLVKFDLKTREIVDVLAEDAKYDVGGVQIHPDTHKAELATVIRERSEHIILDASLREDLESVEKIAEGTFSVVSRDQDDRLWVVVFSTDDEPFSYYLFDRETKEATFLFFSHPDQAKHTLSNTERFSFKSRDGLTIHGYLTFPRESGRKNLPAVLFPHGGPYGRDTWEYSPMTPWRQWIANRGYLCVQVDFRGSVGYGKSLLNAGDKEWAGKMHDDLVDAVNHVIDEGLADPKRIGIFGISYGGYAALVGATFTPDLFRCAVDMVGPSNLITLLESIPPYWEPMRAMFNRRVGNPETERDFLWSRSPLSRVDQIKAPILIGQGGNDPRVKQTESEQIVAAMKERGIDHEYLVFRDEGHVFTKPENNLKFFERADEFLAKHLPVE